MFEVKITAESISVLASKLLTMGNMLVAPTDGVVLTATVTAAVDEQQVAEIIEGAEKKSAATRRKKAAEPTEDVVVAVAALVEDAVSTLDDETPAGMSALNVTDTPAEAPKLSYADDIVPRVLTAVEEHGREALEAILASLGVAKASQLSTDQWPDLLSKIERLG